MTTTRDERFDNVRSTVGFEPCRICRADERFEKKFWLIRKRQWLYKVKQKGLFCLVDLYKDFPLENMLLLCKKDSRHCEMGKNHRRGEP